MSASRTVREEREGDVETTLARDGRHVEARYVADGRRSHARRRGRLRALPASLVAAMGQHGSRAGDVSLPGDDLTPHPTHTTTRAITIRAPASAIWPWLTQMGQDRAGFYTHNWVERLLRSGIPDRHDLHSEWQDLRVGDLMRTNRELRPGHPLGWAVLVVEPNRALVLQSRSLPAGTYAFLIYPLAPGESRLLVRDRAVWRWWQAPLRLFVFEPLHAYMQTGQLVGIRQRVERQATDAER